MDGVLRGSVDDGFGELAQLLEGYCDRDPTYAGQYSVWVGGQPVVELDWGPGVQAGSRIPVFSGSKGMIGAVVGCLLERGLLELDAPVVTVWPEFAAAGKEAVTLRQLLSHQAGLVGVDGGFTYQDLYDHQGLAERLAAQRPSWHPGGAHGYHAVTLGILADELVRRVTGRPLGAYLAEEIAGPRGLEVHLGFPPELDDQVVAFELPTSEDLEELDGLAESMDIAPDGLFAASMPSDPSPILIECNTEAFQRAGTPAGGGLASARGLAGLYAALTTVIGGQPALLGTETVGAMSQLQVQGADQVLPGDSAFGIVFQKPTTRHPWGSHRAFGHDGLGGCLAYADPSYDVAVGYVTTRMPLPGGADRRAVELSTALRRCLGSG